MINEPPQTEPRIPKQSSFLQAYRRYTLIVIGTVFLITTVFVSIFLVLSKAPTNFPINSEVVIPPGSTAKEIVERFKEKNYVKSADLLYFYLVTQHDSTKIEAGTYHFDEPVPVQVVADMIASVGPKDELVRITIPEGITVATIAAIADAELLNFNAASFISYATEVEGTLWPETYFVPRDFTDSDLYDLLRSTYDEKLAQRAAAIDSHDLTEAEIIILASIIEREANSEESMRTVSGILQNRLAIGMPLQADASIEYVLDKPLSELTPEDLDIESPYNTYLNRGLPPTPIGNPGETAIDAVLYPISSDNFFYITDPDGVFHYAETLDQHNQNIARYLR